MPDVDVDPLDDLRAAMQAWYDEATVVIAANWNAYIGANFDERWQCSSDGLYYRIRTQASAWMPEEGDLEQIPSFTALRGAAEESAVVGPLMSHDIGTAVGLSPFNFQRFALAILPAPDDFAGGQLTPFASRYEALAKQLTSDEAVYEVTYFLQNVSFDLDHVELEPDSAIQRLTPQEICWALDIGIFRPLIGTVPVYRPAEDAAFALKRVWRLPRQVGGDITSKQREEIAELSYPIGLAEELLQCFALMSGRGIYMTGAVMRRLDDDFSMFAHSRMSRALPAPLVSGGDGLRLDSNRCAELQQLWRTAHNESFPANKALALAIRRLAFAAQRERAEDRLIDVLIAAEAFYLTDVGNEKDRGELKYRLALRAAVWSEHTVAGWDRQQVRDHMKRAYDLRSAVAHGGEPKAKDIKLKNEQVSLATFVQATEEIVRAALYKAMRQISPRSVRLQIDWESLVLPAVQPEQP